MNSAHPNRYCMRRRLSGTWRLAQQHPSGANARQALRKPGVDQAPDIRYLSHLPPGQILHNVILCWEPRTNWDSYTVVTWSLRHSSFWGVSGAKQYTQPIRYCTEGRPPGTKQFSLITSTWRERQTGSQKNCGGASPRYIGLNQAGTWHKDILSWGALNKLRLMAVTKNPCSLRHSVYWVASGAKLWTQPSQTGITWGEDSWDRAVSTHTPSIKTWWTPENRGEQSV